ncbi:MAG: aminoacyl-tRNA hydrolase [Anaerolineae bacterium]
MIPSKPAQEASYLIVGLGNPGREYAKTRHNVGFQCVDALAEAHQIALGKKRFCAVFGEGRIGEHRVILARPLTFMNESGRAVGPLAHWYKIPPTQVLVIHDDLDLPLGRIRLRPGGSSGGHRGVASVIETLGTGDFPRLRIGIGRPELGDPVDYVLGAPSKDQEPVMRAALDRVLEIVPYYLDQGVQQAMNAYNANGGA